MKLVLALSAVVVAVGCGDNLTAAGGGDAGSNTPPPGSCLPGCAGSASRAFDAVAYDLHASFDWPTMTLTAREDLTLDTTASGPLVQLDAAVQISAVHAGSQDLAFTADGSANTLAIDLTPLGATTAAFTIDYTATVGGTVDQTLGVSLIATTSTSDDPVQSRVVFTDSEPDRALYWLVTKLDPSDRALWSVDLAVDPDEDVIANGTRVSDTMTAGKRVVSYALDKPIPPYLMAFAAGQLAHTDRPASNGVVPLSVWYRKGLVLDPNLTLDHVTDAMTTFNRLIMPYPWDTYSVVLLPYGGGMENATITFNNETSGQGTGDFVLNAHELSHHWFGDWVTMHGYDDVWFKEGMATVLESEAERARRDASGAGRLWGTDYGFNPGDAVVDDSLHSLDKYTSGPYERAGWMITQIRATVGEAAFFDGLRALLAAHAVGSATGEEFIRSFPLDEATVQKLLAALRQKATPTIAVTSAAATGGTQLTFTLTDPGAVVIAPVDLAVIDAAGSATTSHLVPGTPLSLTVPPGGYLGTDERDVHPPWYYDFGDFMDYFTVADLFAPATTAPAPVLAAFESRSAAQQEKAGEIDELPIATSSQLAAYLAALDSDVAKNRAVVAACARATSSGDASWLTAAEPAIEAPARVEFDEGFAACGTAYPKATLEAELASALAAATPVTLARVEYLMSFDYGPDTARVIGAVATTAPSLRLREIAQRRLADQTSGMNGYSGLRAAIAKKRVPLSHLRAQR